MAWALVALVGLATVGLALKIRTGRRQRHRTSPRPQDLFPSGETPTLGVIGPDPAEARRERKKREKARAKQIAQLRSKFTRPTDLDQAIAKTREAISQLAIAGGKPAPNFAALTAELSRAGTPDKVELATRKRHGIAYKERADEAKLAEALACSLYHIELLAHHRSPSWKAATSLKRLAKSLKHDQYRQAAIGLLLAVGDTLKHDRPDVTALCKEEVDRLFSAWHFELQAAREFEANLARLGQKLSATDKHFVINDLVYFLRRRRRSDPSVRDQLVGICEQDVTLYKPFLAHMNSRVGEATTFAAAVRSRNYFCPRLPSFDALWEIYEEDGNTEQLRRLQNLSQEIRYNETQDSNGIEGPPTTPPGTAQSEVASDAYPVEIVEVLKSGQTGKKRFLDRNGTPCSTEEAACSHLHHMGFETLRAEVSFWQAMFGLCFWEEIFDGTGAPNAMNDIPIDLFSGPAFYEKRQARVDAKAEMIAHADLPELVGSRLQKYGHVWTRIISGSSRGDFSYINFLKSKEVFSFLRVVKPPLFARIIHRIALNPSENRAGLPDYVAWKDDAVLVEVKGLREKIRDSQGEWLAWLHREGFPVKVLRIKGVTQKDAGRVG